jgi:antitoxin component YwqK of YwqJK toxin-antitoxin module
MMRTLACLFLLQSLSWFASAQTRENIMTYHESGVIKEVFSIIRVLENPDTVLRDGLYRRFHEDQSIALEVMYAQGAKQGLMKEFYRGKDQLQRVTFFEKDTARGPFKVYYEDGKLLQEGTFEKGLLEDTVRTWYPNGTLKDLTTFQNGVPHGLALAYTSAGTLMKRVPFAGGEISGELKEYYEDGSIKTRHFYQNGNQEGDFFDYHPNGQLKTKGQFSKDEAVGIWIYYNTSGEEIGRETYRKR